MSGQKDTVKVDIVLANETGKEIKRITVDAPGSYDFSMELQPGKYTLKLPEGWVWDGWHWLSTFNPAECPGPTTQVKIVKETDRETFQGAIRARTSSDTPQTPPLRLIVVAALTLIVVGEFPQLQEMVGSLVLGRPLQIEQPVPTHGGTGSGAGGAGPPPAFSMPTRISGVITGELVNVRAERSAASAILDQLPYGTRVAIAPEHLSGAEFEGTRALILEQDWYPIILMDGQRGYVFKRYVEVLP